MDSKEYARSIVLMYANQCKAHEELTMRFRKNVPRIVTTVRAALGLTQREFAALVGCDFTTISKAETGAFVPSLDLMLRIVNVKEGHEGN